MLVCGILTGINISLLSEEGNQESVNSLRSTFGVGDKDDKQKYEFTELEIIDPGLFEEFKMEELTLYHKQRNKKSLKNTVTSNMSTMKEKLTSFEETDSSKKSFFKVINVKASIISYRP